MDAQAALRDTRAWLERAVIGLNLCPFAKGPHAKGQVRIAVSLATDPAAALAAMQEEVDGLLAVPAAQCETTLLVLPDCLADFLDFNDFVGAGERVLRKRRLQGILQLASFHPQFQFAGTDADDITNFTNRSPYPTLHLLREESIDRAVAAFPDAADIYERNMEKLRELGPEGWHALGLGRSA